MELSAQLELVDWGVLAVYFIILVVVGVWVFYFDLSSLMFVSDSVINSMNFL